MSICRRVSSYCLSDNRIYSNRCNVLISFNVSINILRISRRVNIYASSINTIYSYICNVFIIFSISTILLIISWWVNIDASSINRIYSNICDIFINFSISTKLLNISWGVSTNCFSLYWSYSYSTKSLITSISSQDNLRSACFINNFILKIRLSFLYNNSAHRIESYRRCYSNIIFKWWICCLRALNSSWVINININN